jgi:hypothetical protein
MVRLRFIIILLALSISALAQNVKDVISVKYSNVPAIEFCDSLSQQYGVKVYYYRDWLEGKRITIVADSVTIIDVFREAFEGTGLGVSEWNGDLVIMPGSTLLSSLPKYRQSTTKLDSSAAGVFGNLTQSEERYITGRRADVMQTIRIGKSGGTPVSKAKLQGRILDEETGEPIPGATMFISETKTGAVSDIYGFFVITLKPGKYNSTFECLGYAKKKYMLEVQSDGSFIVSLQKAVIQIKEVVVYGDRQANLKTKDPGLDKIAIKSIKELPMMMGERDILKVSGLMPGIVTTGEGLAGLNVRGGGSDQNAFYINKIPIYNTSHLFGFFPAFNSDIIRDFSIYKGFIPAQFGGRLSSVFNIASRQGNRKKFMMRGGISPVAGNIVIESPLKKDTCSVLLSARSTYSDWILGRIKDPDIRNSSANFNDLSAALNYDLQKTQIALFAYHSKDSFRFSDLNEYKYSNNGVSIGTGHNFNNLLRGDFTLIASQYSFSTTDKQTVSSAYTHAYNLGHYEARTDFKQKIGERHSFDYGAGLVLYKLDRGNVLPYGELSLRNKVELGEEQGCETSAYFSDNFEIKSWLSLTAGFRYAIYSQLGPKTVYTYLNNSPMDKRYIQDTLYFGSNKPVASYHEPDLRLAINMTTDESGSVKIAFNQMHQNLFMLNPTVTIAPNTQWKLADYHISPSRSSQVSLGIFRNFQQSGLEVSVEGYYKSINNFTEFRDGADFLNEPLVESSVLQGKQDAWGIEFFLKRSLHKVEGWISYTYSRSMVKVDGGEAWNQINRGVRYAANYDIPHVLNVVFNYHFTRRITFSSVIVYQTGKPITYPVSVYYVNGVPVLDYSSRNAYRIPDYFRTDCSLTFEGNLKKQKLLHNSFVFSCYNATGRENAYSVYFTTENGKVRSYQYSVIAVPIFTVTWQFKLGNYASE